MAEQQKIETITSLAPSEPEVEETSRFRSFTVNHPRTAQFVGIAAITAATLGGMAAWKARQQKSLDEELEGEENVVPFDSESTTA